MYSDVPDAITLVAECGSLPIVWTQGNLHDDRDGIPFQQLKIEQSGIADVLRQFEDLHLATSIPAVVGGPNKKEKEVLDPVFLQALCAGFRRIVVVDDLVENLDAARERADFFGIDMVTYQICRNGNEAGETLHKKIQHLLQMHFASDSLHMFDLDRTLIHTTAMKQDWMDRIAALLPFRPSA